MEEQTLIHSAQRGDLEAFNQVVLMYQDSLFRIAVNILGDEDAAEDATQQAFISAFRNLHAFRGGSLRSWLSRIVVNASYDELRRVSRVKDFPLQDYDQDGEEVGPMLWLADTDPLPESCVETTEMLDIIKTCLQALPEYYRLVILLIDVEGLSYQEAAVALNVCTGTIKSRLARARNSLRLSLQRYPDLIPSAYTLDFPVVANIC